jgi:hypothetical protein
MKPFRGTITDCVFYNDQVLRGNTLTDEGKRVGIRTSPLVDRPTLVDGEVISTQNSRYQIFWDKDWIRKLALNNLIQGGHF